MKQQRQTTLRSPVVLSGAGVHSGADVKIVLHPAEADHGIVFLRTGLPNGRDRLIDARHLSVTATELCTVVGEAESGAVATIEHLMSAFYGLGVDNALVEIDGPEVPILDGSAAPFVEAIDRAGIVTVNAQRRYLKVLKTVRVACGKAFAELRPNDRGFRVDVEIDFPNPVIGRQRRIFDLSCAAYRAELSRARTFGFMRDVERLWKAGFALSGLPLLGSYKAYCGGHRLNLGVLEALFASRSNYAIVEGSKRRETGYAEIGNGIAVPAYAPGTR